MSRRGAKGANKEFDARATLEQRLGPEVLKKLEGTFTGGAGEGGRVRGCGGGGGGWWWFLWGMVCVPLMGAARFRGESVSRALGWRRSILAAPLPPMRWMVLLRVYAPPALVPAWCGHVLVAEGGRELWCGLLCV